MVRPVAQVVGDGAVYPVCGFAPGPVAVRMSLEATMGLPITEEPVELPEEYFVLLQCVPSS